MMKKTYIAIICCTFLITAPTYGDEYSFSSNRETISATQNSDASARCKQGDLVFSKQKQQDFTPFKFDIGGQYSRVRQFAHNMPKYTGNLGGIFAEFEYKKRNSVYADATALWNWGSLTARQSPKTGVNEGVWEGDLGGSYSWGSCNRWTITAFTGFGYRRYVNNFDASASSPALTLEYQNYFVPVGFKLNYDITSCFRISLNGKVLPSVDEKLYVYSVSGTYWRQARKPSFAADLPITWSTGVFKSSYLEFTATPFFRYWQLGSVDVLSFPTWKQVYWGAQGTLALAF